MKRKVKIMFFRYVRNFVKERKKKIKKNRQEHKTERKNMLAHTQNEHKIDI
jgi:hypothetical protein